MLEEHRNLISGHFGNAMMSYFDMVLRSIRRFDLDLPFLKLRNEGFVAGEHREYAVCSREDDGECVAIEDVLSDARDRKMEALSH